MSRCWKLSISAWQQDTWMLSSINGTLKNYLPISKTNSLKVWQWWYKTAIQERLGRYNWSIVESGIKHHINKAVCYFTKQKMSTYQYKLKVFVLFFCLYMFLHWCQSFCSDSFITFTIRWHMLYRSILT
jgi:hypothetical protein